MKQITILISLFCLLVLNLHANNLGNEPNLPHLRLKTAAEFQNQHWERFIREEIKPHKLLSRQVPQKSIVDPALAGNMPATVIVHFNDANLEQAVREALDIPTGDISDSAMATLGSFTANNREISDLTGMEYAINCYEVFMNDNQISDLTPLAGLTRMGEIYMANNSVSDMSPISGLTELRELSLGGNQISDVSSISGVTNLNCLGLGSNQISDISSLSGLVNMEWLDCGENQITDISALSGMAKMKGINFWKNGVEDISVVANMPQMEILDFDFNQVQNIDAIAGLTQIKELWLTHNQFEDISAVAGLTNLEYVNMQFNKIQDISALINCTKLKILFLSGNEKISDLSALTNLTNLQELKLYTNQISDLSPLSGLTGLTLLWLHGNQISDISALSNLTNLRSLGISGNRITNIDIIQNFSKLSEFWAQENKISSVNLSGFNQLSSLYLSYNEITSASISDFSSLRYLFIGENKLSGLSLSNLPNLERIYASGNQFTSINLPDLPQLQILHIDWNPLTDISNLSAIPNIWNINLNGCPINDITPLTQLTKLKDIMINGCGLTTIDPLSEISAVEFIGAKSNNLTSVDLSGARNLWILELSQNQVSEIKFDFCRRMREFNIEDNLLDDDDLPALKNFRILQQEYFNGQLDLRGNLGFSEAAIRDLANALSNIDYEEILWEPINNVQLTSEPAVVWVTENQSLIRWSTNLPVLNELHYSTDQITWQKSALTAEVARDHEVPLSSLTPGTLYYYKIFHLTSDSVKIDSTDIYTFETLAEANQAMAQLIGKPQSEYVGDEELILSCQTDEPVVAACQLLTESELMISRFMADSVVVATQIDTVADLFHIFTFNNLQPATRYYYQIGIQDSVTEDVHFQKTKYIIQTRQTADTQPPILLNGPFVSADTAVAVLTFKTDEGCRSSLQLQQGNVTTSCAIEEFRTDHQYVLPNLKTNTTYQFEITLIDKAGNSSTWKNEDELRLSKSGFTQLAAGFDFSFTTNSEPDEMPPLFTQKPEILVSADSIAAFQWATDELTRHIIEVRDHSGRLVHYVESQSFQLVATAYATRLKPGTTYSAQIIAIDLANNQVQSPSIPFETPQGGLTVEAHITSEPETFITTNYAAITWKTDLACDSRIQVAVNPLLESSELWLNTELTTDHILVVKNLLPNTTYFYQISGNNLAEEVILTGKIDSLTTQADESTLELLINEGPATELDSLNNLTITWKTNLLASSNAKYYKSDGTGDAVIIGHPELTKNHTIMINKLVKATEYSIEVYSTTTQGQKASRVLQVTTSLNSLTVSEVKDYQLFANYPNPFNPATTIKYHVKHPENVKIAIYNTLGEMVRLLVNRPHNPGRFQIKWNGKNDAGNPVSSGIYFYRCLAGEFAGVRKMLLLK